MLEDHKITKEERKIIEDLDKFDSLLKEAWDKPWWRRYMKLIEEAKLSRTNILLDPIKNGVAISQREEDILRGEIRALAWIMAIDARGKVLHTESGGS